MYDRSGVDLIRLSTEVQADYEAWLDAIQEAGSVRRDVDVDDSRTLSRGPSEQISPSNSGLSDTTADTASSAQRNGGGGWKSSGGGGSGEMDSAASLGRASGGNLDQQQQQQRSMLRRQPSGYTSDASEVGVRPQVRSRRAGGSGSGGGRGGDREACAPVHLRPRFSLLSSERITITNQSGLLTLVFLVLAATNFRLILENMMKYGLRFNPFIFIRDAVTPSGNLALLLCWPALLGFSLMALGIELFAARCFQQQRAADDAERKKTDAAPTPAHPPLHRSAKRRSRHRGSGGGGAIEHLIFFLNFVNISLQLFTPCWAIHITDAEPMPSFALTMAASVLWLKLVSFAHVNWAVRHFKRRHPRRRFPGETLSGAEPEGIEEDDMVYPKNLVLSKFLYFLAAPTLCYQLSYPRSPRIRLRWMLRRLVMFGAALGLMLFFFEQYIEPTIDNSLKSLQEMDWLRMAERILKLSIPTLYFWLAMFYALFDLWLNILAEATRFGDREFYKEWWNATTLGEYWRLWNMPVHKWMVRHVYFPCLNAGVPKFVAGVIVFFVSAVFHELLVGVPLHMLRGWAFWGIMTQVPLMWVTEVLKNKFNNDRVGNVIFWVSFCFLGQPLAEILYFHDWRKAQMAAAAGFQ